MTHTGRMIEIQNTERPYEHIFHICPWCGRCPHCGHPYRLPSYTTPYYEPWTPTSVPTMTYI